VPTRTQQAEVEQALDRVIHAPKLEKLIDFQTGTWKLGADVFGRLRRRFGHRIHAPIDTQPQLRDAPIEPRIRPGDAPA
jgi:hypothetical protein